LTFDAAKRSLSRSSMQKRRCISPCPTARIVGLRFWIMLFLSEGSSSFSPCSAWPSLTSSLPIGLPTATSPAPARSAATDGARGWRGLAVDQYRQVLRVELAERDGIAGLRWGFGSARADGGGCRTTRPLSPDEDLQRRRRHEMAAKKPGRVAERRLEGEEPAYVLRERLGLARQARNACNRVNADPERSQTADRCAPLLVARPGGRPRNPDRRGPGGDGGPAYESRRRSPMAGRGAVRLLHDGCIVRTASRLREVPRVRRGDPRGTGREPVPCTGTKKSARGPHGRRRQPARDTGYSGGAQISKRGPTTSRSPTRRNPPGGARAGAVDTGRRRSRSLEPRPRRRDQDERRFALSSTCGGGMLWGGHAAPPAPYDRIRSIGHRAAMAKQGGSGAEPQRSAGAKTVRGWSTQTSRCWPRTSSLPGGAGFAAVAADHRKSPAGRGAISVT